MFNCPQDYFFSLHLNGIPPELTHAYYILSVHFVAFWKEYLLLLYNQRSGDEKPLLDPSWTFSSHITSLTGPLIFLHTSNSPVLPSSCVSSSDPSLFGLYFTWGVPRLGTICLMWTNQCCVEWKKTHHLWCSYWCNHWNCLSLLQSHIQLSVNQQPQVKYRPIRAVPNQSVPRQYYWLNYSILAAGFHILLC